jgi:alpha-1,2-mannosyltransferase
MYGCMLGAAAFMNWRGGLRTAQGIFWFAAAGILGWPFASALCAPYMLEEIMFLFFNDKDAILDSLLRISRGVVAGLILLVSLLP